MNIDLHIPLNPLGGNTINIAQEIARKYGRDAINPRAAAHRALLLEVAEAANRIGGGATDDNDMGDDLNSDMGDDSNVEMGGMEDEKSGTGDNKPVRKRKPKTEEYDKEDEFIDDTELAWQQGAAVTKDGFFVFSGPLVPAGESANVESNAPARGRARGRGRGGRGAATGGATLAVVAEKTKDASVAPTRARGGRGGGRATTAVRKPRVTKADKERLEAEKTDRERTGGPVGMGAAPLAAVPLQGLGGGGQAAAGGSMG